MQTKRLLIVEDDYDVAEMLLMYFTAKQYEVYHADTGVDGIELARKKLPNLILLDVMLPELNGYEVCAHLRNVSLTKHIPVIFLTQKDGRADIVEGLELGADDYIAKPFDVDELRLRVQRSIERATRESLYDSKTGLPTGPMAEEEITRMKLEDDAFIEMRFSISGFAAFNDKYGFMSADQVMGFAAKCIYESVTEHGTPEDFVGYVENRFVIVTKVADPDSLLHHTVTRFNEGSRAFYTFIDVDNNGILVNEGTADERLEPLMQLEVQQQADV